MFCLKSLNEKISHPGPQSPSARVTWRGRSSTPCLGFLVRKVEKNSNSSGHTSCPGNSIATGVKAPESCHGAWHSNGLSPGCGRDARARANAARAHARVSERQHKRTGRQVSGGSRVRTGTGTPSQGRGEEGPSRCPIRPEATFKNCSEQACTRRLPRARIGARAPRVSVLWLSCPDNSSEERQCYFILVLDGETEAQRGQDMERPGEGPSSGLWIGSPMRSLEASTRPLLVRTPLPRAGPETEADTCPPRAADGRAARRRQEMSLSWHGQTWCKRLIFQDSFSGAGCGKGRCPWANHSQPTLDPPPTPGGEGQLRLTG